MSNSENTFFVQSKEERSVTVYKRPKYYEVVKGFDTLNWFSIYSKIEVVENESIVSTIKRAVEQYSDADAVGDSAASCTGASAQDTIAHYIFDFNTGKMARVEPELLVPNPLYQLALPGVHVEDWVIYFMILTFYYSVAKFPLLRENVLL